MQEFSTILTALTIAGGLALGVERLIEFLKHIMEMETRGSQQRDKLEVTIRAVKLMERAQVSLDSLKLAVGTEEKKINHDKASSEVSSSTIILDRGSQIKNIDELIETPTAQPVHNDELQFVDSEGDEKFPAPHIPVIAYETPQPFDAGKLVFYQLAAAGLGMMLAGFFDLHLMRHILGEGLGVEAVVKYPLIDIILTGMIIGGGSQPIHVVIRFLTERNIPLENKTNRNNVTPMGDDAVAKVTAQILVPEQVSEPVWKNIEYSGGVNPLSMDNKHVRITNPNLVVYHHTAMSSNSSFQKIVDEFLVTKKWLTGYNCVIMPDGAIKPFCRWDRYGNHAKGKNMKSLGIALHGNFETRPNDKYSNADGRYGNQEPTEEQLKSAARVVALWVNLYNDIHLDFEKCILPHHKVMPANYTVCPGNNFPVTEFETLIRYYYEAWINSEKIQVEIDDFKTKKYLYV